MESLLWLPQFLFLLSFQLHFQASCHPSLPLNPSFSSSNILCLEEQSHALLQFKSSFSIKDTYDTFNYPDPPPFPKTETWKEGTDCCLWDGVSCDLETGNVISLNLSASMLYGTFHSNNSLFSLSHLQKLDLSYNNFISSNIPSQFGRLLNLTHLNLNSSSFVGRVPLEISHLSHLVSLDLSWNYGLKLDTIAFNKIAQNLTNLRELILNQVNMSVVSPSSFMNLSFSLQSLSLGSCGFQGKLLGFGNLPNGLVSLDLSNNYNLRFDTTAFVKLVQNLTELKKLTLSGIDLSMVAPSSFLNLSSSLSYLNLGSCGLSRKFTEYIQLHTELVSLDLSWNEDLGLDTLAFAKLVQNLTKLKEFDLSYVDLSSVAPISLTNLSSSLTDLRLFYCRLQGKFPNNLSLPKLISLDFSFNYNLTIDTIVFNKLVLNLPNLKHVGLVNMSLVTVTPISLMNLSSSLSSLVLVDCGLQGEFPSNFFQRPSLQDLDLSGNDALTGFLPRSNWNSSLKFLDISWTKIIIYLEPRLIGNLRSVKQLYLGRCKVIGSNLALLSNLTQLTRLDLSYSNFNGEIPSSFGNIRQLTFLDLSSNNFSGNIPSSFANLEQLRWLALQNNSLSGPLPAFFSNFTHLYYLDLHKNQLIGSIPSQIVRVSSLYQIDLSNNFFNGSIPSGLFSLPQLGMLFLNDNQLQGRIGHFQSTILSYIDLSNNTFEGSIPSSIFKVLSLRVFIFSSNYNLTGELSSSVCNLQSLEILDLSNNSLTGFIPQCLGNFSNSLSVLHLHKNNFLGTIPTNFSEGNGLRYLNFNGNQLQGGIPPSTINCRNLELLDLGNNEINDTFPFFLASLPNLQILVLRSNKLHGSLQCPIANCSFPMLRVFVISNNTLSGPLPEEYFNGLQAMMMKFNTDAMYMTARNYSNYDYSVSLTFKGSEIELPKIITALATIDLSLNKFTGKIPKSIGKLKSLKQLNISHNYLIGNIPPSLGNLSNLESLDLSSNLLTGRLPMQLLDLTFLAVFRVAHNQLEGPIPNGKQFNTFDISSYEGNARLCGPPLSKACEANDSDQNVKQGNLQEDDSDFESGFGWKALMTGYGCGQILGFSMAYVVFTTRKPRWFVNMVEGAWTERLKIIFKIFQRM